MDSQELDAKIMSLKKTFVQKVTEAIKNEGKLHSYLVVWNQLQNIASPVIAKILENDFKGSKIIIAKSKSTYPDIKMDWNGFTIAIDIKSNESCKNPWYDIARLDTIVETRLEKYDEEYDLVVKYDSKTNKLLKIFFEPMRYTVGIRGDCGGVKFRPYDGKLRPKTWEEFDKGVIFWKTKKDFLKGIEISKKYRRRCLAKKWVGEMTGNEKASFRKIFKCIFSLL